MSLRENAILTIFGTTDLAGNVIPKYTKGWGGTKGDMPEMEILTAEEEIVPNGMWVVNVKARGGIPVDHTYQQKNMYVYIHIICIFTSQEPDDTLITMV